MRPVVRCHTFLLSLLLAPLAALHAAEPKTGESRQIDLGGGVKLEVVYLPPGEFMMGSTPEEKKWATGIEGGAQPGTERESYESEKPRLTRVKHGVWMGRTEVSVGQCRRFALESKYVTDAEKPDGKTQVFDPEWDGYHLTTQVVHPWKSMPGKSWRDPNWGFPNRDVFPVVCVSYNDMNAFCRWLTERERKAGRLPGGGLDRQTVSVECLRACLQRSDLVCGVVGGYGCRYETQTVPDRPDGRSMGASGAVAAC